MGEAVRSALVNAEQQHEERVKLLKQTHLGELMAVKVGYEGKLTKATAAEAETALSQQREVGEGAAQETSSSKVPWVLEHDFLDYQTDNLMRSLLAQPIQYMLELDVMYGWLFNYEQSIFLRQTYMNNAWGIKYSPVIESTTRYTSTGLRCLHLL
ncbi:uncharacterized protein N7518_004673 [Penicillium psychrosexuale]|uniref:uncharacterized protein n=1 Tax=Penicillium psychrosexuale TaxID=1002107 RepID=UPI0025450555|nr:uncharacterized protein N7518_004673 [Penicillium psychrosexuale]KAJ5796133.1 hypothetical protein N7518_004673 [Penicillium psychrosexuale]